MEKRIMFATSTPTTYFSTEDIKNRKIVCTKSEEEYNVLVTWVREHCKGGFVIGPYYLGQGTIWLRSDSDYAWYLLTWA